MTNGILNELETVESEYKAPETVEEAAISLASVKMFESLRIKKSVQFADGIKPGEGTSPSGNEGDMPSPPPPTTSIPKDDLTQDISKKLRGRKIRKKQKRTKPQKPKKKVKVRSL